jgi:hypothetical protein
LGKINNPESGGSLIANIGRIIGWGHTGGTKRVDIALVDGTTRCPFR